MSETPSAFTLRPVSIRARRVGSGGEEVRLRNRTVFVREGDWVVWFTPECGKVFRHEEFQRLVRQSPQDNADERVEPIDEGPPGLVL